MPVAVVAATPDRVRRNDGSRALIDVCGFSFALEVKRTLCLALDWIRQFRFGQGDLLSLRSGVFFLFCAPSVGALF